MKPATRTFLGLGLFVPIAMLFFAMFACLPAPIGDPEKSKVDESLTGAWQSVPKNADDKDKMYALIQPWDGKTYFLQYVDAKDPEKPGCLNFKAWLTTIAGAKFIVCQPLYDLRFAFKPTADDKQIWPTFRIDKTAEGINIRMVKADGLLQDKTTREQIEAVIKDHVNEDALYGDALTFKKLSDADRATIEDVLKKLGASIK